MTTNNPIEVTVLEQYPKPPARIVCYGVADPGMKDNPIAIGTTVIDAWNAAERILGDSVERLQKDGYILVEGIWQLTNSV